MLRNTGNSERKQRGQFDVCFIQQLIIEPITDSLDPDTTVSSLRAIVIWQKYFGNHVISSQIHLFAPLLNMMRCTLWKSGYNSSSDDVSCFL